MIEWRRLYAKPAGSLPGGIVTQWGAGIITLFVLVFLTYWIWFGGEGRSEDELVLATQTDQAPGGSFTDRMAAQIEAEALRAETRRAAADRALRARQQQQTNNAGPGPAGAGANEAMLLAGPSPEHRATLYGGRMGTPGTTAPGSHRAAQPFASQFAGGADLPATGRCSTGRRGSRARAEGRARKSGRGHESGRPGVYSKRPSARLRPSPGLEGEVAAEAEADRAFIEALRGISPTASRRACQFLSRARIAGGLFPPRLDSVLRKIPPVGSASMKARFWKRSWSRSSPATFRARSWPWFPCRFTQATGSVSWCREGHGSLARPGPWRTRTNRGSPLVSTA